MVVRHAKHLSVDDAAVGDDVELKFDYEGGEVGGSGHGGESGGIIG